MKTNPTPPAFATKPGDLVRVCHPACMSETRDLAPLVPARLSRPLLVTAVTPTAVRVGEQWCRSWVRVNEKPLWAEDCVP